MKRNLGELDVMIRGLIAFAFLNLAIDRALDGQWIAFDWVMALLIGATSFAGFCPVYWLFHMDSHSKDHHGTA